MVSSEVQLMVVWIENNVSRQKGPFGDRGNDSTQSNEEHSEHSRVVELTLRKLVRGEDISGQKVIQRWRFSKSASEGRM